MEGRARPSQSDGGASIPSTPAFVVGGKQGSILYRGGGSEATKQFVYLKLPSILWSLEKGIGPELLEFSQSRKFLGRFLRSRNRASRAFRTLSSFLG